MAYSAQRRLEGKGRLLDEKGQLAGFGWNSQEMPGYDRSDVSFIKRMAVREWDTYTFGNERWQISFSIADCSSVGVTAVSVTDLKEGWHKSAAYTEAASLGRYELPNSSGFGDTVYRSRNISINITRGQNERRLTVRCPNFDDVRELYLTAVFSIPEGESLHTVIPFKNKSEFYASHRTHCMPVSALMRCAGIETHFDPKDTLGTYEWSRGVMPRSADRVRSTASTFHNGEPFGFILGKGFGDRSECGENAFFYKGKVYKIGEIDITVPSDPEKEAWGFVGEEGDINLRMVPDCSEVTEVGTLGLVKLSREMVFGLFYGTLMLRDNEGNVQRLVLDGIRGCSEEVRGKW